MSRRAEVTNAPFEPHPFLREAHAMTLAGLLPRAFFGVRSANGLPPGEDTQIRVDATTQLRVWVHRQPEAATKPLAVLLHGLSGSSESRYVLGLGAKLFARGFSVARMNMRNCGDSEHLTETFYCTAQSGDVLAAAQGAREICAAPRVHVCGWSMGGNMVLKMAGELGCAAPPWLASVAAVSPAMDLEATQIALDEVGSNEVYRRFFLREMLALFRRKERALPGRFDSRGLERIDTFLEWDERVTAPQFGFADAADFYRRGASRPLLPRIAVPLCVIHAQDDPFVPFAPWRDERVRPAGRFEFLGPLHGGHCGFIAARRARDSDCFWAEQRVAEFFEREEILRAGSPN
ncbi:MAG: alpha/beta fold hydrolase [Planctomycetota bacterium]